MKIKLSGVGFQTKVVKAPGVLLTLNIFRLNIKPDPAIGVKSSEKAEMRKVMNAPGPERMFAETFQLLLVIPAPCTSAPTPGPVVPKLQTVSLKTRSPWKPT